MGTAMQVRGMFGKKRWQHGVSLAAFFAPPRLIGPRPEPRKFEPIVQQYFLRRPEDEDPEQRPHWARDKPIGHLFKENPYLLKRLRDAAKQPEGSSPEPVSIASAVEEEQLETDTEEEGRPPPIVIPEGGFLPLWNLQDNPFSRKTTKRLGRGIGSGKGKTCGRGQKGQKARRGHKPRLGFEGGQTPLRVRLPKKHESKSPFELQFKEVGLDKIKEFIEKEKIDPSKLITMKTLHDTRCSGKYIQDGVLLLGRGQKNFDIPIHIEVSRCTKAAKEAIEAAGGTVRKVHYNKLGLKALIDPLWFKKKGRLLPKAARPKPKIAPLVDSIGRLPAPLSPVLPEGFVLKAPVYGYPWAPQADATQSDNPKGETKDGKGEST